MSSERVFSIFKKLNAIPRPSHREEKVANFLCQFAERLHLEYERDSANSVLIRKPASPGHEQDEPIVLLNHMDMLCVGADNGIGLSMALAVLESDDIVHGPLEVITTTNDEDACLQVHEIPSTREQAPIVDYQWFRITISGGLGGHSVVDIDKGHVSAVIAMKRILHYIHLLCDIRVASLRMGEANALIASSAEAVLCVPSGGPTAFVVQQQIVANNWLKFNYGETDPYVRCKVEKCEPQPTVIDHKSFDALLESLEVVPQGVIKMSETMADTVESSNNIGIVETRKERIFVSTYTHSLDDEVLERISEQIAEKFKAHGAYSYQVMTSTAWTEDIGPRIVEPYSTSELVEPSAIDDIWKAFLEMLSRMAV